MQVPCPMRSAPTERPAASAAMVVGTAGTTGAGMIDPLGRLRRHRPRGRCLVPCRCGMGWRADRIGPFAGCAGGHRRSGFDYDRWAQMVCDHHGLRDVPHARCGAVVRRISCLDELHAVQRPGPGSLCHDSAVVAAVSRVSAVSVAGRGGMERICTASGTINRADRSAQGRTDYTRMGGGQRLAVGGAVCRAARGLSWCGLDRARHRRFGCRLGIGHDVQRPRRCPHLRRPTAGRCRRTSGRWHDRYKALEAGANSATKRAERAGCSIQ